MINRLFLILELLLLLATLALAGVWIRNPAGNFEPYTIVFGVLIAVIDVVRRSLKSPGKEARTRKTKKKDPDHPAAKELLNLIHDEPDNSMRGIVQNCQEIDPGMVLFFPRLQYEGKPLNIKARHFKEAIEELIERNWLLQPEYNESTDTITYEYRA